jgi:hypothetical protein
MMDRAAKSTVASIIYIVQTHLGGPTFGYRSLKGGDSKSPPNRTLNLHSKASQSVNSVVTTIHTIVTASHSTPLPELVL